MGARRDRATARPLLLLAVVLLVALSTAARDAVLAAMRAGHRARSGA